MKKRKMLIVGCMVMMAGSMARAEDMGISFDGRGVKDHSLSLAGMNRVLPDFEAALPVPVIIGDVVKSEVTLYKLGEAGRKILQRIATPEAFDQKVMSLIRGR